MSDGTSFSIDILAKATGADAAAADVLKLADALDATTRVATPFDGAVAAARSQLAGAAAAAKTASDALGDASGKFNRLEREARRAALAVEKAGKPPDIAGLTSAADAAASAVRGQMAAVADAERAMAGASGAGAAAASESFRAAMAELTRLEGAAKRAQGALEKAGRPVDMGALRAQADAAKAALLAQASAVDKAKASASAAAAEEQKLAAALKTLEGSARTSGAAVKAGGAQASVGLKQIGASASSSLAAVSPMAGRLGAIGTQLAALGPIGLAVAAAVGAIAVAAMAANAAWSVFQFALMANTATAKRIDEAFKKARKSTAELFAKVDSGKVAGALESVLHLLDANTSTGRALQKLMGVVFNPIMDAVSALAPLLKELFIGAVVGALRFATVAYRVRNAVLRAIPPELKANIKAAVSAFDAGSAAFEAGKYIFTLIAVSVAIAAAAFGVLAAACMVPVVAVAALVAGIVWLAGAIGDVLGWVAAAEGALGGMAAAAVSAGVDFVSGLVSGIASGVGAVAEAARNLATSAVSAVKSALGIASPSKLLAIQGGFAGEGLAVGVRESEPEVRSAVDQLVSVATEAPQEASIGSRASVSPGGSSSTTTNTRGGNTYQITINAPTGEAEDIRAAFERWLTSRLEAEALSLGGGEVPA